MLVQDAHESDNLLPESQSTNKSEWELFSFNHQSSNWTDGSEVLVAECKKKSTPSSLVHSRENARVACGQFDV